MLALIQAVVVLYGLRAAALQPADAQPPALRQRWTADGGFTRGGFKALTPTGEPAVYCLRSDFTLTEVRLSDGMRRDIASVDPDARTVCVAGAKQAPGWTLIIASRWPKKNGWIAGADLQLRETDVYALLGLWEGEAVSTIDAVAHPGWLVDSCAVVGYYTPAQVAILKRLAETGADADPDLLAEAGSFTVVRGALGDFDGRGAPEAALLMADSSVHIRRLERRTELGLFPTQEDCLQPNSALARGVIAVAAGDLDSDGRDEVVVRRVKSDQRAVLEAYSAGGHRLWSVPAACEAPRYPGGVLVLGRARGAPLVLEDDTHGTLVLRDAGGAVQFSVAIGAGDAPPGKTVEPPLLMPFSGDPPCLAVLDAAGRLTAYDVQTPTTPPPGSGTDTTFTYDNADRKTQMVHGIGTTNYTYDNANRLTQVEGPYNTVSYGYDNGGRRTSLGITGQNNVTYSYNAADYLTSLTNANSETTSWTYNDVGLPTRQDNANSTEVW